MKAELKIASQENTLTQETVKSAEESLLQAQIDLNTKASQNQENEKYSSEELSQLLEELESQVEAFDDVLNSAAHESILALISKISDTLERARESEGATKDTIALKEFKLRMQKDILDEKIEENEQKHIEVSSEHGEPEVKFGEDFESMQRKSIKNCIGIIENTMKTYEELKLSVEVFNGTTNDNTYKLLVISLETMIQSLMQIEMRDAHEVREKHGQALVAVQDLLRQLQDQAKATCKTLSNETALFLGNYKKDLKKIESGVESFDHITDSDFYNELYSQIQNMFLKLEKARGEGTVKPEVLSTIQSLLQKSEKNLKERAVIRERKEKERQEKMNILSEARKCFDENSKNLSYLQNEVSKFQGNSESVQFRFLEDQLTGLMHFLDRVELKDEEELRQEYMSCIAAVQCVLTELNDKAESFVEHTSTMAQSIPDIAKHCELELNTVIDEIEKTSNPLSKSQINHIFEKLKLIEQHLNQIPEEHATMRENVSSLLQITFKKLDANVNKQKKAKTETLIDQNSYPASAVMASLATQAVQSFTDLFDKYGDPRVQGWLLMSSPLPTLAICLGYVYLVKVIGPKFMENRKPFELRKVLIWYNAFQVVFSAWLFYELGMSGWFTGDYNYRCQPVDYSNDSLAIRMVHACWWYYFSKFTEFFDTIFFVLRKKNQHVSSLHVIHHGIMPMSVWFGVKFTPGGHSTFFGLLNTFVHIIMYFYYMVAAMGPQYQKYIWWKKYLTSLQMIQFIGIMSHAFQLLFTDCNYPRAFVWWIGMHAVLFFYLFSDFYNNTYKSNNKQKFSKQKSVMQSFAKFVPCNLQMDKLYSNGHTKSNGHTGNGLVGNGHTASSYYINGDLPQELRHRTSEAAAVVAAGN